MNTNLDMALDDIIKSNKQSGGGGRGRGRGGGAGRGRGRRGGATLGSSTRTGAPLRARRPRGGRPSYQIAKSFFSRGGDGAWRRDFFDDVVGSAVQSLGIETGTKLYISNLDYGVSNEDIKELFSEVGDVKRCGIHYDRSGRSKGTAEVVYSRRLDAVAAMKRYNNVQLDGKPMKIELIGTNLLPPITRAMNGPAALGRGRRPVTMNGARGRGFGFRRFRGRGRGRGRRPPIGERIAPTVAELDAELEKYHQDAMQTS